MSECGLYIFVGTEFLGDEGELGVLMGKHMTLVSDNCEVLKSFGHSFI